MRANGRPGAGQRPEEAELGGSELELVAVGPGGVVGPVDLDPADADDIARRFAPRPAEQRFDPMNQRLDFEGFGDVVVGPHVETDDLVNFFAAGGQHEDADVLGPGVAAKLPADFEAVDDREHQIQNDDIGLLELSPPEPFLAVGGEGGLEAFLLQVVGEDILQRLFVFHNQDPRFAHRFLNQLSKRILE